MKLKSFFIASLLLIAMYSFSNRNENSKARFAHAFVKATPPPAVLSAFNDKFPTAQNIVWHHEDRSRWEADFFIGTREWRALYKADGTLINATRTK